MNFLKDRSTVLALSGAGVALVAGLSIALVLVSRHRGETVPPPAASQTGLVIDPSGGVEAKADPASSLRCFVSGQFVGEMSLADCAHRNGVATDALDVGLDRNGALAAANQAGEVLTPLPPPSAERAPDAAADPAPAAAAAGSLSAGGPPAACWRYAESQWRRLPAELPLAGCVQTLFAGRCERPGGATYGRWGVDTLRLMPGRVEISADNHSFRTLVEPWPGVSGDLTGSPRAAGLCRTRPMLKTAAIAVVVALAAGAILAGCEKSTEPLGTPGICYHVVPQKDGSLKYNKLVTAANLETCAANLEAMRIKFLSMGGSQQNIYGAYQANFLFLQAEGVLTSTSLEGPRYVALVRTGDGRLAIPGAMPQPAQ